MTAPIPVVCDRCRAEGWAGRARPGDGRTDPRDEDPFAAFGALLDFDPVPRRANRVDGWTPDVQRAFVAALSLTGSAKAACRAVGKAQFGVNQLYAAPGSESFRAACDEAMEIAADERSRRLAEGLRTVAAEQSGWRPPEAPWAKRGRPSAEERLPGPGPAAPAARGDPDELDAVTMAVLIHKYLLKLEAERSCRLAGRIAEADFYIRQVTMLEVAIDVVSGDGMAVLKAARLGEDDLLAIAQTPMSMHLDGARRAHFDRCGDPPRPIYPPPALLVDRGGHSTEPLPATWGGLAESREEQLRLQEEQFARDAAAQVEWEAAARRDYKERGGTGEPYTEAELREREAEGPDEAEIEAAIAVINAAYAEESEEGRAARE